MSRPRCGKCGCAIKRNKLCDWCNSERSDMAEQINDKKRRTTREAFAAIWEAGGKAWDDVEDPDKFIRELRGDIARDELPGEG